MIPLQSGRRHSLDRACISEALTWNLTNSKISRAAFTRHRVTVIGFGITVWQRDWHARSFAADGFDA